MVSRNTTSRRSLAGPLDRGRGGSFRNDQVSTMSVARARRDAILGRLATNVLLRATGAFALGLVASCHASHGRETGSDGGSGGTATDVSVDTGAACLTPGAHVVRVTLGGDDQPAGCFGSPVSGSLTVHVPPTPADYGGMCGGGMLSILPTDVPCTWAITADCPTPDGGSSIVGTFSAPASGVSASFLVDRGSLVVPCRFRMTFEPIP